MPVFFPNSSLSSRLGSNKSKNSQSTQFCTSFLYNNGVSLPLALFPQIFPLPFSFSKLRRFINKNDFLIQVF